MEYLYDLYPARIHATAPEKITGEWVPHQVSPEEIADMQKVRSFHQPVNKRAGWYRSVPDMRKPVRE